MTRKNLATVSCMAALTVCLTLGSVANAVPDLGDTSPEIQLAEFQEMLLWAEAELDAAERLLAIQEQYVADLTALYDETGDPTVSGALRHARVAVFQTRSHMFEVEQIISDLEAAIAELEAMMQPEDRNPPSISDTNDGGYQFEGAASVSSALSSPSISDASEPGFQVVGGGSMGSGRVTGNRLKPRSSDGRIVSLEPKVGTALRCAEERRDIASTSTRP